MYWINCHVDHSRIDKDSTHISLFVQQSFVIWAPVNYVRQLFLLFSLDQHHSLASCLSLCRGLCAYLCESIIYLAIICSAESDE